MVRVVECSLRSLVKAAEIVIEGGLIVYPTDTVYGLGCNPYDREAVERLLKVKGREGKPLPVLVSGYHEAFRIARFNLQALKLAGALWPGPLTMVLPRKPAAPPHVGGGPSIGVRIPGDKWTRLLISFCGGSLVGTSANLSGEKPAKTALEAKEKLGEMVDLILDGGPSPLGEASTVVSMVEGKPQILRAGSLRREEIFKVLNFSR
ncbi:MAG: L-threonylcarbamoyladenylate synthase [Candidatus Hecatellaceae archaeon]